MVIHYTPNTLGYFINLLAIEYGSQTAIRYYRHFRFQSWTYEELVDLTRQCAHWLLSSSLNKGDKIMIYANNCPQWTVVMLAAALAGIVVVPVDRSSPLSLVSKIADLTEAKVLFTDVEDLPNHQKQKVIILEDLFELIKQCHSEHTSQNDLLIKGDDVFEIMYTSGTTDAPKGVVITNSNIITNIIAIKQRLLYHVGWNFLSVLPLSHILEQNLGCISVLRCGGTITYINRAPFSKYVQVMADDKITHIVTVPALLENLQVKILEAARNVNKAALLQKKLKLFHFLPFFLRRILSYPIRRKLSSSLNAFICGGAVLDRSTEQFWEDLGIKVSQGYGLTEASPIVSCNSLESRTAGSVGWPVAQQYLRLSESGEILIGGENVSAGYFNEPALTNQYFENGWYKTGDIGRIDDQGKLYILGRAKEMIVTASGMNVFPTDIEAALNKREGISESVVFEDPERKGALIGAVLGSFSEEWLDACRHQVNSELASHQHLSKLINWIDDRFPKTTSLKLKRKEVDRLYKEWLESQKSNQPIAKKSESEHPVLVIIAELIKRKPDSTLKNSMIKKDLEMDSLEQTSLILTLEERYNVDVDQSLFEKDLSVETLCEWIDQHKGNKQRERVAVWPWNWLAKSVRFIGFALLEHGWFRRQFKIHNDSPLKVENLIPKKPIFFVANHSSHLDATLIASTLPGLVKHHIAIAAAADHFFEKKSSWSLFFKRLLLPIFPFQRTGKQQQNMEIISKLMARGNHIILFPEGTRSRNGQMQSFKSGIGLLVKEFDAQVVPIYIQGAYALWPSSKKMPSSGPLTIRYGKPRTFGIKDDPNSIALQVENAVKQLMSYD